MATEDKTFVSTRATKSVNDAVDQYGVIMVTGPPGSGKTATVNHIALQLQEQGYTICPVVSTKEIIEYWMPEIPQVFVYNDPFGIHDINQSELHQWTNQQERLRTCFQYSNMKILATIRSHIIKDEQISGDVISSSDLKTVSLVNDDIVMTDDERLKIFNAHATFQKREDLKAMGAEIQNFKISCFPLLCKINTSDIESKFSDKDFFQKPFSIISKDLDKFKINDPIRYFCLLYCMMNDNHLETDLLGVHIERKIIKTSRKILLEKCNLATSLSREKIKSKMNTLVNTYLKLEGTCYQFIHDIIHDAVIKHVNGLSLDWKRIILQHCGPKFLNDRIRLNAIEYAQTGDGYLILNPDLESEWRERIQHDMINDHLNWNYMLNNTTLLTEKADMLLLKSLKCMDQTELQKLILLSHPYKALTPVAEAAIKLERYFSLLVDMSEVTILHLFICLGLQNCLEHIVKTTPSITLNQIKKNLLLVACLIGKEHVTETLLLNGYSANVCVSSGYSVLLLSSMLGHVGIVKGILLEYKADIDRCDMFGTSPLFLSSKKGHVEVVKMLLEYKADIDICNNCGQSPLFISSENGHVEVVKILLEHEANIDKCDIYGRSPLYVSSENDHVDVVKILLKHEANIDKCDIDGRSSLFISSRYGHVEVVKILLEHEGILLEHEANIDKCDKLDQSPLFTSSLYGHVDVVKLLLEHEANIDKCDKLDLSPLFISSRYGHVDVVKLLLEHEANVDKCNKLNQSPLFISIMYGHVDVVRLLLEHKANIDKCDNVGQSPLFTSSMYGHVDVVKLLLEHEANIDKCDKLDHSPLFISSMKGHVDVVKLLLEHEANVDKCNNLNQSPLCISIIYGHVDVVKLLLEHKANVDKCNNLNQSPLFISSMYGHVHVVKLLLEHEASIDKCDNAGQSPLFISSRYGHVDVVELLLEHKANIDKSNNLNQSPLFISSTYGHVHVVKLLLEHKANIDKCDNAGQSPLFISSRYDHVYVVKLLLKHEANIHKCNNLNQSPLFISSVYGHVYVVELLLEHEANIAPLERPC